MNCLAIGSLFLLFVLPIPLAGIMVISAKMLRRDMVIGNKSGNSEKGIKQILASIK